MKKLVFLLGVTGAIIYSCSSKTTATAAAKPAININAEFVAKGQPIFEQRCNKCHKQHEANEFTAEQWEKIIAKMAPKAKLTEEETSWILAYATANAKK